MIVRYENIVGTRICGACNKTLDVESTFLRGAVAYLAFVDEFSFGVDYDEIHFFLREVGQQYAEIIHGVRDCIEHRFFAEFSELISL